MAQLPVPALPVPVPALPVPALLVPMGGVALPVPVPCQQIPHRCRFLVAVIILAVAVASGEIVVILAAITIASTLAVVIVNNIVTIVVVIMVGCFALLEVMYKVVDHAQPILEAAAKTGFKHVPTGPMELCLHAIGSMHLKNKSERAAALIHAYQDLYSLPQPNRWLPWPHLRSLAAMATLATVGCHGHTCDYIDNAHEAILHVTFGFGLTHMRLLLCFCSLANIR